MYVKTKNCCAVSGGTTRLAGSKKEPGTGSSMKDKDREMAKAINAEFSDDDEKDEDVESNWDEDEKVITFVISDIDQWPFISNWISFSDLLFRTTVVQPHEEEDGEPDTEKKVKDVKRKKDKQESQTMEDEEEKDEDGKEDDEDEKAEVS